MQIFSLFVINHVFECLIDELCRSDKFKSLYKCVQAFEFIRSAKGHQLNIQKHDLRESKHQGRAATPSSQARLDWLGGRADELRRP